MDNNSLDQLKDIHLPDPVSVFPLAPGWYLLIALIVVGAALIFWQLRRLSHRRKINNIINLLNAIEGKNNTIDTSENSNEILAEVSVLLKRVAREQFPTQNSHILFGQQWLVFLDNTGHTESFTKGEGRYLGDLYKPQYLHNPASFFAVVRDWLRKVL